MLKKNEKIIKSMINNIKCCFGYLSNWANMPKRWCEVSLTGEKEEEANEVLTDGRNRTKFT